MILGARKNEKTILRSETRGQTMPTDVTFAFLEIFGDCGWQKSRRGYKVSQARNIREEIIRK